MVLQNRRAELQAAWRALNSASPDEGWRTIPVAAGSAVRFLAGRHFPGNRESLLVGLQSIRVPLQDLLPKGRGFTVSIASLTSSEQRHTWIALSREPAGGLELFTLMADDIVAVLMQESSSTQEQLLQIFLSRIRAWQDFMKHGADGVLGPEQELGLCGELAFLGQLLDADVAPDVAVGGWNGPLDGVQDFALGTGAVEVKATIAPNGFPAKIASLAQLDSFVTNPLVVAGVRFSTGLSGSTLPEIVASLRTALAHQASACSMFDYRILRAGYHDAVAERYTRRILHVSTRLLCVDDAFPKLIRSEVDLRIRDARYEIDLDLVQQNETGLDTVLQQLGVK